jgi:bacteriocin-like protein
MGRESDTEKKTELTDDELAGVSGGGGGLEGTQGLPKRIVVPDKSPEIPGFGTFGAPTPVVK